MEPSVAVAAQKTLAYFDQFSHPLTARELFCWLWGKSVISEIDFLLHVEDLVKSGHIQEKNGYYFLPGRDEIVEERARKFLIQDQKIKLAKQAGRWLTLVPFVEGIFICNTVAAGWPNQSSDIDLFVVVRPGRLWLTRSLFTGLTALLNRRRHGTRITDHLCLSFYVTSDHLNLESVRISKPDIYLTYWVHQLIPLYTETELHQKFLQNNFWTKEFLPQVEDKIIFQNTGVGSNLLWKIKKIIEFVLSRKLGQILENKNRTYQLSRINKHERKGPPHVVVNDSMLKFHESDRREEYQNNWYKKCHELGL